MQPQRSRIATLAAVFAASAGLAMAQAAGSLPTPVSEPVTSKRRKSAEATLRDAYYASGRHADVIAWNAEVDKQRRIRKAKSRQARKANRK